MDYLPEASTLCLAKTKITKIQSAESCLGIREGKIPGWINTNEHLSKESYLRLTIAYRLFKNR